MVGRGVDGAGGGAGYARGCDCCRYTPRLRWLVLTGEGGESTDAGEGGRSAWVVAPKDSMGLNCLFVLKVDGVKMRGPLL